MNAPLVIPKEQHESYWQPEPSRGWMSTILTPEMSGCNAVAAAIQSIDAGCKIRPHAHRNMDEILFILDGEGVLLLDDEPTPVGPGDCCWLGRYVKHELLVDAAAPLRLLALLLPPATELAWRHMGMKRALGDPPPPPYGRERFDNLGKILTDAGFAAPEDIEVPPAGQRGVGIVMAATDGERWDLPQPFSGFVTRKFSRHNTPCNFVEMGTCHVKAGGVSLARTMSRSDEIILIHRGTGIVWLDDLAYPANPDTLIYVPAGAKFHIEAEPQEDMQYIWCVTPPAPSSIYESVGKSRSREHYNAPFPLPDNFEELVKPLGYQIFKPAH
jgi:mannose-6-phosphate isomerase-like protein (cupin superfamily)